jgi:hypothetical protein
MHEVDAHNLSKGSHIKADDARTAESVEKGEHPINSYLTLLFAQFIQFRYPVLDNRRVWKVGSISGRL